jgi:hypothetical protein
MAAAVHGQQEAVFADAGDSGAGPRFRLPPRERKPMMQGF